MSPPRYRKLPGSLTGDESEFAKRVKAIAKRAGWLENHTYKARIGGVWRTTTTAVGWPDHVFAKRGRLLVLELKAPGGKPSDEQLEWIALLDSVPGCTARVVWPADWPWIMDQLTGPTQPTT